MLNACIAFACCHQRMIVEKSGPLDWIIFLLLFMVEQAPSHHLGIACFVFGHALCRNAVDGILHYSSLH
jgi:hypothetical protein